MDKMQKIFDEEFNKFFSLSNIVIEILKRKFKNLGYSLTKRQEEIIKNAVQSHNIDGKPLEDLQITFSGKDEIILPNSKDNNIRINLYDEFSSFEDEILDSIKAKATIQFIDLYSEAGDEIYKNIIKEKRDEILKIRRTRNVMNHRINRKWGNAIDLLIFYCDIIDSTSYQYKSYMEKKSLINKSQKFEALFRLSSRGCQVAKEISILLSNGFPDGAHARWRTLHEISVISNLLAHNEEEYSKKYLEHSLISELEFKKEYQKYSALFGGSPFSGEEISLLEDQKTALLLKYGKGFGGNYGWAFKLFNHNPTFVELENIMELKHIRPFYLLANQNVHGGSGGLSFRLGLSPQSKPGTITSGASLFGFTEPGQNTAYSIFLLLTSLILYEPNLDYLALLHALSKLKSDVFNAFLIT